jgi:hypothetical protein
MTPITPQPDWTSKPEWCWHNGGAWIGPTRYGAQIFIPPKGAGEPVLLEGKWQWTHRKRTA